MTRRAGQIAALLSLLVLLGIVVAYQFFDQQKLRGDVLTGGYEGTVVCGNETVEADEECDDGNTVSDDGCSDTCLLEESETPAPDTETPNSETPDTETPDSETPDTETPDTETPDTETPDTESDLPPISLEENIPVSTSVENGLIVHKYITVYGQRTILDGLQLPQYVPSFRTKVKWVSDPSNPSSIEIEDVNASRTAFLAPPQETELKFTLEAGPSDAFIPVAQYLFTVVSPVVLTADANRDGIYDFTDLLDLLQNWQTYGNDAAQVLSVILSRYQE